MLEDLAKDFWVREGNVRYTFNFVNGYAVTDCPDPDVVSISAVSGGVVY